MTSGAGHVGLGRDDAVAGLVGESVPVLDDGKLVGALSEGEIVGAYLNIVERTREEENPAA